MVEFFKRWQPSRRDAVPNRHERRRGNSSARGYDPKWEKLSTHYRREHPFCERCLEIDRIIPAELVDHKIPVVDAPELRLDKKNLWSLCRACHGWKSRLEAYARTARKVFNLIEWCDNPKKRPRALQYKRNEL